MRFFKLILSNTKKTLSDYVIYFMANTLLVALLFSGNFIGSMYEHLMVSNSLPFIIFIVTIIVLGYFNKFMINKKGKEFTIYMLIGLSKHEVIQLYSAESLFLLVLSFFIGIPLGIGYAYFAMYEKTRNDIFIHFVISAFKNTVLYFLVVCAFVIIFSIYYISKQNLRKLITINNSVEKVLTYKNLKRNLFILLGLILLFFVVIIYIKELMSIISILVCMIIYLADKCIFDFVYSSRIKHSKWIYYKENLYIGSKMLKKYKSRFIMSVILNICFAISACAYVIGHIFLFSQTVLIGNEMDEIMGYIQTYIAILFLIVITTIIDLNQMVDIIDSQRDIFILRCLGKNKKQIRSIITAQIVLNILLSVGTSALMLIVVSLFASLYVANSLLIEGVLEYLLISALILLCSKVIIKKCCIKHIFK